MLLKEEEECILVVVYDVGLVLKDETLNILVILVNNVHVKKGYILIIFYTQKLPILLGF